MRLASLARDRRGAGAVEFALVAPVFLVILLGIVTYGYVIAVGHGLQQLAGEAARAAVSGITDGERATIARGFVAANLPSYGVLQAERLRVSAAGSAPPQNTFEVALAYDTRDLFFARFAPWLPLPEGEMRRAAVIQRGGY